MQNQRTMEPVSKEEWVSWKGGKVTRQLVYDLLQKRTELLNDWSEGRFDNDKDEQITKGRIQELRDIVEYIIHDFQHVDLEEQKSGD